MKYKTTFAVLIFVSTAMLCGVAAQINKPTVIRKQISLKFGGKEIVAVELENTHSRSYTKSFSRQRCVLTDKAEGVIWKIVCEGEPIDAKDVALEDEKGRKFQHTCWSSQGTVYKIDASGNRTGGGPQTEFLAFGPDDSKKVKITFGDASAEIQLPLPNAANFAADKVQQEKQASESESPAATVTFLDGSTQRWENLQFIYEWERDYTDDHHPQVSPRFLYLANSRFGVYDRIKPRLGYRIEAVYSDQLKFKHIVLTAKPIIEGRVIETRCEHDAPCIYAKAIRIKGACDVGGQQKECSATLMPLTDRIITDKAGFVKEIAFTAQ